MKSPEIVRQAFALSDAGMYSKHWPCLFPQHGPGMKYQLAEDRSRGAAAEDRSRGASGAMNRWNISVNTRESVALLDRFVGPKC